MNTAELEQIFCLILKNSSTCSILVDLNGKIIRYNDAYKDLIGYNDDEVRENADSLYISKTAFDREIGFINQLLSGSKSDIKFESTRLTKDNRIIPVEVNALLFTDKDGNPEFVLKRIEDISERIKSDEFIKSRLTLLKTILDEVPINIYIKDLDSRFILVSNSFLKFVNCKSIDEVIGKTDFDFFKPDHANEAFRDEQEIIRTGKSIEKEEKETHIDNTVTYELTTKSPLRDEEGKIIGTYGISKDITDIKNADDELVRINKELKDRNAQLHDTIEELGRTQNELIFAEKMAALGSLIGGIAHEINTPLGAIKASSSNINEVVDKIDEGIPWLLKNASKEEIDWLFKILSEADAREISVFSKEERQKKRVLTSFFEDNGIENAPVVADTIVSLKLDFSNEECLDFMKQPNAQQLLQMLKVLFSLKRNANNIFVSVNKAAKVVTALRSYIYKNAEGEYETTDFMDTINTVLVLTNNMIKHSKTEIITKFESVPQVFCRQDEICQIWTNIITNAIQAMGEGGTLEIGLKYIEDKYVQAYFKDNGPGIPEEIRDKVFSPYFTTKPKGIGTGMGLDISKQIVESHGGKIYFDTEVGKGTTFYIEIPAN